MKGVPRRQTYVAIWALLVKALDATVNIMRTIKRTQKILFTALEFMLYMKWLGIFRTFLDCIGFVMLDSILIFENKFSNENIKFNVSLIIKVIFFNSLRKTRIEQFLYLTRKTAYVVAEEFRSF